MNKRSLVKKNKAFLRKNRKFVNKDRFFVDDDKYVETYYNPDASAGGQYVFNTGSLKLIMRSAKRSNSLDEFFSYLDSECVQFLYDIDEYDFEQVWDIDIKEKFEGRTLKTMNGLIKHANSKLRRKKNQRGGIK